MNFIIYFQESKSDTTKDAGSTKSGKHKKHKKEKKKKKHKEKDKDREKSKKHKHKDQDKYDKDKHKKNKSKSDKMVEELSSKEMDRFYEKHGKELYKLEKKRSRERFSEREKEREKHSKSKDRERDVDSHLLSRLERKSDVAKTEVPLVERRVKHKIHLDGDDFIENQVSLSGKESTDDERVKRKHKHKDKRKDDSPDRGKEKTAKLKEKEAKVKLEHLDDDEDTVGFTEKEEEKPAGDAKEATENVSKTDDADSAIDDKDNFKLPQRKVDDDHVSSVFERNISLKMPNIKPLEKYKELKKKDKLAASELCIKLEKKEDVSHDINAKPDDSKNKTTEKSEKETGIKQGSSKESKDSKKKGLPDMRLISVLPKRKAEVDDSKTVGETKALDDKSKTPDTDEDRRKVRLAIFSSE